MHEPVIGVCDKERNGENPILCEIQLRKGGDDFRV